MIRETTRDLFDLNVSALAHGCNISGIMNAGIAKEFKKRYPDMYKEYRDYCGSGNFNLGEVHFYRSSLGSDPHIINVAIQPGPATRAQLYYVESGLREIEKCWGKWGIYSLGMPRIGCGLGRLDWRDVKSLIREIFGTSKLEVLVSTKR